MDDLNNAAHHDIYVNNLVANNKINWSVKGAASGTVSSNPLFVDYRADGTGNYRLSSSSPAIA